MPRTLILGGGFGGIACAVELRRLLGEGHEIVLVDRRESFSMGLRKLWELVDHAPIAEGSRKRELLARHGIRVVRAEVESIDPDARSAVVGGETMDGDHLVVALGAETRPDLVEGLAEHGHDVWSKDNVPRAAEALARLDEGARIVILIAGAPYPCPPAPYECAMLVAEHLDGRAEILVATVQPILMPNAGKAGSEWMGGKLAGRGIATKPGCKVERVEAGRVVLEDGELPFDLLLAVPPHRVPAVVESAGLTAANGWVAVDKGTLATRFPGVYAVGDVTLIPLANKLPLPKAGVMAERQGVRVAAAIAADLRGEPDPQAFDGKGFCFVELGTTEAGRIEGDFYADPEPKVEICGASGESAAEKREFERERLTNWFGG